MEWIAKLPTDLRNAIRSLPHSILSGLEEIRIREGQPVCICSNDREYELKTGGQQGVTQEELEKILMCISDFSPYACQEELAEGFLTMAGGCRVGVCGTVFQEAGKLPRLKDISSLNIRICKEVKGCADALPALLVKADHRFLSTVIVSPPKCGKTTMIRDLVRLLSQAGFHIGVVDERGEIAGTARGVRPFDLGPRTDVLNRCKKTAGLQMLIRTMAPDIVVTDEIGTAEDRGALREALCAGVGVLATMHGACREDLLRSGIGALVKEGEIERIVYLGRAPKIGTILRVTDSEGRILWESGTGNSSRPVVQYIPAIGIREEPA